MNVIVYTAVFNDYDIVLAPRVRGDGARYVCISDRPSLGARGWEMIPAGLAINRHPYAQRYYKILSHRVFAEADVTLYIDGNFELKADPFFLIESFLGGTNLALFRHPRRRDVYEELQACADLKKDDPRLLDLIADRYKTEGMPRDSYLHSAGFILRRHTHEVAAFNEAWFKELVRSGVRDQPALAHTLWKTGIAFETLDHDIRNNEVMDFHRHKSKAVTRGRRFLFACGNPRTGTTALSELLNHDPRIVMGRERYRRIRGSITPEHFTEERFFAPTEAETSFLPARLVPPGRRDLGVWPIDEEATIAKWRSSRVAYVGDKAPFYLRQLPYLRHTFPDARFIITIRDPVAVADSYQRRAEDTEDHWPRTNDFRAAIEHWNRSLHELLADLEVASLRDSFLVDYETFFSGDQKYLLALYDFLELDPSVEVMNRFEAMTADWDSRVDRPLRLDAVMEAEVRDRTDWDSYMRIRQLIPLMRDYGILAGQRTLRLEAEAMGARQVAEYRELRDLSRLLFHTLSQVKDVDAGERMDRISEAEVAWDSFWYVLE